MNLELLLSDLEPDITRRHISFREIPSLKGILILEGPCDLETEYLYIGESGVHLAWLRGYAFPRPATVLLTDDSYLADPLFSRKNLNILTLDIPLLNLYNRLNRKWIAYQDWSYGLARGLCDGLSADTILASASGKMQAYIFLLNNGYRKLAGTEKKLYDSPLAGELLENGYLGLESAHRINTILKGYSQTKGSSPVRSWTEETGTLCHILPLEQQGGGPSLFLLLITNASHHGMDLSSMLQDLGSIVRKLPEKEVLEIPVSDPFRTLMEDFSKKALRSPVEIQNRMRLLSAPPDRYIYCMILDFDKQRVPYAFIIHQLRNLLPGANLTTWKRRIVVLLSSPDHRFDPADLFDTEALNTLLEMYGGYAILSTGTSHHEQFPTLYNLCRRLMRVLLRLKPYSSYGRVYKYNDHLIYLAIDLSTQYYQTLIGHDDIIYMADPAVIKLSRYDQAHNMNLRQTLYCYLICGRNVSKTAEMMYVHRNTVLNKINKISELIGQPLDDGIAQQRLLFSCQLLDYYTSYLNLTFD